MTLVNGIAAWSFGMSVSNGLIFHKRLISLVASVLYGLMWLMNFFTLVTLTKYTSKKIYAVINKTILLSSYKLSYSIRSLMLYVMKIAL